MSAARARSARAVFALFVGLHNFDCKCLCNLTIDILPYLCYNKDNRGARSVVREPSEAARKNLKQIQKTLDKRYKM